MRVPINDRTIDKLKFPIWVDFQAVDVNHARALMFMPLPVNSANSVGSSFKLAIAVM
jgi:hypothetical protein